MKWSALMTAALVIAPAAHANEKRVVTQAFVPDEVVKIVGRVGVQSTVAFGPDESIENVAVGDSSTWQITPNKRATYLFVKPLNAPSSSNMTVVTNRRTYLFDLVTSSTLAPVYLLKFSYPDEPEEALANSESAEQPIEPRTLNFRWSTRGKNKLYPSQVYDDGHSTYLSWPAGSPIPAILIENRKGSEGPVNYAVRNDTIVIEGVPRTLILRSGKDRAILENRAEQPADSANLAARH